ncbi:uncharacterized protein LOC144751881 [Ciona intestinalis]
MAFFAIAELVVAIVHSVYCCKFSQTSNMPPQTATVIQYTNQYLQPQQQQQQQQNFGVPQQMPVTSISHQSKVCYYVASIYQQQPTTTSTTDYRNKPLPPIEPNNQA